MRLLTHNSLRNNSAAAKGGGFPLTICCEQVRVDDSLNPNHDAVTQVEFIKRVLPNLDWPALVHGATSLGIPNVPPALTEDMANDDQFLSALYHILMNVHLVEGTLTCPTTGREFPVKDEIPNFVLSDEECGNGR